MVFWKQSKWIKVLFIKFFINNFPFILVFIFRSPMEECDSGYYSLGGSTTCKYCPAGYQCPTKNVSIQKKIFYNTLSLQNLDKLYTEIVLFIAIFIFSCFQSRPTICAQGYFSVGGQITCHQCPSGYSCESIYTNSSKPCPEGNHNWN